MPSFFFPIYLQEAVKIAITTFGLISTHSLNPKIQAPWRT